MEVALLPQLLHPCSSERIGFSGTLRAKGKPAKSSGKVVPTRGLEPVSERCPKGSGEGSKETRLKLQGGLIFFRKGGQAPRTAFTAKVSLAGKTRPLSSTRARGAAGASGRMAGAWLGLGTRPPAWLGPASAPGASPPGPRNPVGCTRPLGRTSPAGARFWPAGRPGRTPGGGALAARPPLKSGRAKWPGDG